jgi:hypothetical protein
MAGATAGAMVVLTALPELAMACEHCYGSGGDSEVTRGIGLAMGALIGVTGMIGAGTFAFFRKMTLRSRLLQSGDYDVTQYGELVERNEDDT